MKVWGSWEISEISAVSMKFIVVTCYITATRRAAADAADVACGSVSTAPESRNEAPIQLRRYRTSCRGKNGHSKYRQHGEVPQNAQCNHSFSPFIITECRKQARYSFRHGKPKPSSLQDQLRKIGKTASSCIHITCTELTKSNELRICRLCSSRAWGI